MTLQNLNKILDKYEAQLGYTSVNQFAHLKGLPFYNWQSVTNDSKLAVTAIYQQLENRPKDSLPMPLTFNHAIGLPQKDGRTYPLFDYEQMLFDTLQSNKHVWIKKATGLGVTEFMLRYMAWLCFRTNSSEKTAKSNITGFDLKTSNIQNTTLSNTEVEKTAKSKVTSSTTGTSNIQKHTSGTSNIRGSQMCIVTGPRIELAITLIDRMKGLFHELGATFDSKETVIELNGVHIEAYPSHHLDAMRGLKDVSFIYLDEADFFPPGQQQDARDVSERYIGKSNPWIVMVSTPNAPEGLFERIEKEPNNTCLYKRMFLDYTYGLNRIYLPEEIEKPKVSPSFEREYNLKYLGLIGNVFHTKDIEIAIEKGKKRTPENISGISYTQKSVGLDCGFGSSNFGVCITELVDGMVNVLHAEEYHRPDFNEMITLTTNLLDEYDIRFDNGSRIFVDGANPSFIRALKDKVNESIDYEQEIAHYKKIYATTYNLESLEQNMFVIPVSFAKEHKHMLAHCKELMEYQKGFMAIHPKYNKLITSLRTAVEKGEGSLDKEATSFDDLFDSFRLSLMFWH